MSEEKPKTIEAMSGMINARDGSPIFSEIIGTSFLAFIAIILLFSLLRAQKRNRELVKELLDAKRKTDE